MTPTLRDGDVVFFRNYLNGESLLKLSQIVIFNHPINKMKIIKRIKVVSNNGIEVFGDNINFSDDSKKFGFVKNEEVIGIVTSKFINLK